MNDCIFCKIINKEVPAFVISEDNDVIVFLSQENHPLVVPKAHIKDIYELDTDSGHHVMDKIIETAKAVKVGLETDGVYITQANEPAAGQEVFHIHFHVYPKWIDKQIDENLMPKEEIVDKIKAARPNSPTSL